LPRVAQATTRRDVDDGLATDDRIGSLDIATSTAAAAANN
jgi:hypothetical protein